MRTEWKSIPEYPWYMVSNTGLVKSIDRKIVRSDGKKQTFKGKLLSTPKDNNGYPCVNISNEHGRKTERVHRLVLLAFVGPCPLGFDGCHNNGIPSDCRVDNLRWDSHKENSRDMVSHGRSPKGEKHHHAKLTEKTAMEVYRLSKTGVKHEKIAKEFGISRRAVGFIANKQRWAHIHEGAL